jgi:hypothetical protein
MWTVMTDSSPTKVCHLLPFPSMRHERLNRTRLVRYSDARRLTVAVTSRPIAIHLADRPVTPQATRSIPPLKFLLPT